MTPERWQQIRDLLERAMELAPGERPAFLDRSCAGDPSLRQEVETLLASSDDVRTSFMQSQPPRAALSTGTRVGEYEIKSLLGSGGMGEVYRAHDSRLGRDVAIKVLPPSFSADANRLRRFEQEARAAAALNHPNILAVFQLGTHAGSPYLVTELLEGEPLRELLRRGRLTVRRVIDYGVQIAHGLSAAHEKGIVHRDLKPENLFVTKDGRLKILDFGLARLTQSLPSSEQSALTAGGTEPGMVMGTVGYMSPEQVRAQPADHRTDIFSFGAILFEMLTGTRAFQKPTSPETMSAILNDDPPSISQIGQNVPPALQRVVSRCLEKSPEQRFQSASDLAFALDALSETTSVSSGSLVASAEKSSRKNWLIAAVCVAVMLLALASIYRKQIWHSGLAETGFHDLKITSLTSSADVISSQISPDGKYLAYVSIAGGRSSLWVRQIETNSAVNILPATVDFLWAPTFSPDGNYVNYLVRQGRLHGSVYAIPTLGGTPRLLIDPADSPVSFSTDGSQVVYALRDASAGELKIMVAKSDGSGSRPIATEKAVVDDALCVRWSPDGKRFAVIRWDADDPGGLRASLSEVDLASGRVKQMAGRPWRSIRDFAWLPDGSGLILAAQEKSGVQQQLWVVTYPGGERRRISNDLMDYYSVSVSVDGKSVVGTQWDTSSALWAAPADSPDAARQITSGHKDGMHGFTILPDNRIVYTGDHAENWDLFISDIDGQNMRQLSFDGRYHDSPTACENGQSIVYSTDSLGIEHIWKLDLKGGSNVQVTNGAGESHPACSPMGSTIYYTGRTSSKQTAIFKIPAAGGTPVQVSEPGPVGSPSVSPDGKHVIFLAARKDGSVVYKTFLTETTKLESEYPAPSPFWASPHWTPDNHSVVVEDARSGAENLWALPVLGGGREKQVTHFKAGNLDAQYSPDGKRLVMDRGPDISNAVLFREASQ